MTAEGIECLEQLALLADLSPIYLQGYLLARPVPPDEVLIAHRDAARSLRVAVFSLKAGVSDADESTDDRQ